MPRILTPRLAALAVVMLLGLAVVVAMNSGRGDAGDQGGEVAKPLREKGRKVGGRPAARGRERTKSGREMRGMSVEQVLSRLPSGENRAELKMLGGSKLPEESVQLLRRLGRLEGEAALDEIIGRYGNSGTYAAAAAVQAIVGWMEVDREAAIAAFRELTSRPASAENGFAQEVFCWKGTGFVSGFG